MKVLINLMTPPDHNPHLCERVVETIRTGFPTADLMFYDNGSRSVYRDRPEVFRELGAGYYPIPAMPHYTWIDMCVRANRHSDQGLILLDGDMIFWDSVEDFVMGSGSLAAGMFIPSHYNHFLGALVMPRIHTSFLQFRSGKLAHNMLSSGLGPSHDDFQPYLRANYYEPHYSHIEGKPVYFDTCAEMYGAFHCDHFDERMLNRYTHIGHATFQKAIMETFPDDMTARLRERYRVATVQPNALQGLWRQQLHEFNKTAVSLQQYLTQ